jgi:hypothetical protein
MAVSAAVVLFAGALLPLGEAAYPGIYPIETPPDWTAAATDLSENPAALDAFLAAHRTVVLHGRLLYPRFYGPGDGETGTTFPILYPEDGARMTIFVAGPVSSGVLIIVADPPDFAFAHVSDVLVIGCRVNSDKEPYVEAAAVYLPESGVLLERAGGLEGLRCPLEPVLP